jgi:hypothetical protein
MMLRAPLSSTHGFGHYLGMSCVVPHMGNAHLGEDGRTRTRSLSEGKLK